MPKPVSSEFARHEEINTVCTDNNIYALVIHNIKLSRKRKKDKFLTHPVPEFLAGDKVLVRYYTRYVWDQRYDVAYYVV